MAEKHIIQKTAAYITQAGQLLVFSHLEFPEAGLQVPGGSVEEGEGLEQAALREAQEETGLENLKIVSFLGTRVFNHQPGDGAEVEIHRHFFHMTPTAPIKEERWLSTEEDPSDGSPAPILLECYWIPIPDGIPELAGNMGDMLDRLLSRLA